MLEIDSKSVEKAHYVDFCMLSPAHLCKFPFARMVQYIRADTDNTPADANFGCAERRIFQEEMSLLGSFQQGFPSMDDLDIIGKQKTFLVEHSNEEFSVKLPLFLHLTPDRIFREMRK